MHSKFLLATIFLLILSDITLAQNDTLLNTQLLDSVSVNNDIVFRHAGSVTTTQRRIYYTPASSNPALFYMEVNSIPGVRMEERSPGSYRLNIRGSGQRAPFGIRNVKIYWNDIPLTEPGGNTYLNQLNASLIHSGTLLKGPQSNIYGAGTGGTMLLNSITPSENKVTLETMVGSFGQISGEGNIYLKDSLQSHLIHFSRSLNQGYREHSAMERVNFFWNPSFQKGKSKISGILLYSDLFYQTPGGLTEAQYRADPKQARAAAGIFPGATEANAYIDQRNILTGLTYHTQWPHNWELSATAYASFLQLHNPTFRNYEIRNEPHTGFRIQIDKKARLLNKLIEYKIGAEAQHGNYQVQTYENIYGNTGILSTNDEVKNSTAFAFAQATWSVTPQTIFQTGLSMNYYQTGVHRFDIPNSTTQYTDIPLQWLPKFSLKHNFGSDFSIEGIAAKGYSPPVSSEVLPSNSVINTLLRPEYGWNYEVVLTKRMNGFLAHLSLYQIQLSDAIVQRKDLDNADYFINAGQTSQKGVEAEISYLFTRNKFFIFSSLSGAYNHYVFDEYQITDNDYSGNTMPGTMRYNINAKINIAVEKVLQLNAFYGYNDKMYLNDANTFSSAPYHLTNLELVKEWIISSKAGFKFLIGVNNLLNDQYSLGFDFNAAADRFYNAAPGTNYYGSVQFSWKWK